MKWIRLSVYLVAFWVVTQLLFFQAVRSVYAESWHNTTSLPLKMASHTSSFINNRLFVFGGSSEWQLGRKNTISSETQSNGELIDWNLNHALVNDFLIWHSTATVDDGIYIMGGAFEPSPALDISIDKVLFGEVNELGSIPSWKELNPLKRKLSVGGAAYLNGRVYYLGGSTWENSRLTYYSAEVYSAKVLENGEIEEWVNEAPLPKPLEGMGVVADGKNIYVFGGRSWGENTYVYQKTSYRAVFDPDGKITGWDVLAPMPKETFRPGFGIVGSYVVSVGGELYGELLDDVFYAEIKADGTLGDWQAAPDGQKFPTHVCCGSLAVGDNYLYHTGGFASGYTEEVYFAPIGNVVPPTETPTPTPTPTPVPQPKTPIVLIPGMGASWNYKGMVENEPVPNSQWKVGSYTDLYEGLIRSLEENGYEKNSDLFIYAYDWRRNVWQNSAELEDYVDDVVLADKPAGTKIDLVGHSMGGLVARAYAQDSASEDLDKLITVGTPHTGSVMAYRVWEGGDLSSFSIRERLGLELLVRMNYLGRINYVQTIQEICPSGQNLLPIFDYLKSGSKIVPTGSLKWQNNFLANYSDWNLFRPNLTTIYGSGLGTSRWIKTVKASGVEKALGKWVDGKPVGEEIASGDNTVLLESGKVVGATEVSLPGLDHGEIISSAGGQRAILDSLGIDGPIFDVSQTKVSSAIVATVASPATFVIEDPDGVVHSPSDGLLVIANPKNGEYLLKLTATGSGKYTVYFGRISETNSSWSERAGVFQNPGETEEYLFQADFSDGGLGADPIKDAKETLEQLRRWVVESSLDANTKRSLIISLDMLRRFVAGPRIESKVIQVSTTVEALVKEIASGLLGKKIPSEGKEKIIHDLRLVKLSVIEDWENNH